MATGPLLSRLYGDAEMAALVDDRALIPAMLRAEAALARAEAAAGVIPTEAADAIAQVAASLRPDPVDLAAGVAKAGIAAQPVINALKAAAGEHAGWVHFGATSQDILDTALVLQRRAALDLLENRLRALDGALADQAAAFARQPIPARTRFQTAAPTTLGARIAIWRAPLPRHLDRLAELRPRILLASLYGAAGTGAALGAQMADIRARFSRELELGHSPTPWHTTRDGIAELAGWLSLVSGNLGKMGADLLLMAQDNWVRAGTGGGSSTMPQKSNPVGAEALVTLARANAGALATIHQALIHAQERDGTALGLEWLTLPDMLERTAASLRIAANLAATITADTARIEAAFADDRGAMLAEAAGFALSARMPRDQALRLVGAALAAMQDDPKLTLAEALAASVPDREWRLDADPLHHAGEAISIATDKNTKGG